MNSTTLDRQVDIEVAHNVRHMGGYRTHHGATTSESIIRSASLHRLTEAGMAALADLEVRTIVDLRSTAERQHEVTPDVERFGISTIHAPVFEQDASPGGLSSEEFPGFAIVYGQMLDTGRIAYRQLFEVIAASPGRVLFHCAAGKDRTGVGAALLLALAGVPEDTILEDFALSARLLAPLASEWLPLMAERGVSEERGRAMMAAPPEDMRATLVHIETTFGGVEGCLRHIWLSPTSVSELRAKVLD